MRQTILVPILGFMMLATLAFWLFRSTTASPTFRSAPELIGVGNAFAGNPQLPQQKIDGAIEHARSAIRHKNTIGNRYKLASQVLRWLAFLIGSAITVIAGFKGLVATPDHLEPDKLIDKLKGDSMRLARVIAVLGAFAAICTSAQASMLNESVASYKAADDLQHQAATLRKEILDATSVDEARQYLDGLDTLAQRL